MQMTKSFSSLVSLSFAPYQVNKKWVMKKEGTTYLPNLFKQKHIKFEQNCLFYGLA